MHTSKSMSVFLFMAGMVLLGSCISSKKIDRSQLLFQRGLDSLGKAEKRPAMIHVNDNLSISFFTQATLNQEQADLFNVLSKSGYTVNEKGMIQVPVIGNVHAEGLTANQLEDSLKLLVASYVKDPLVVVKPPTLKVIVIGENRSKGTVELPVTEANLVNLFANAGYTENARLDNVLVIREDSVTGIRSSYRVDMTSGALYQSPVFQLKENDVVYTSFSERYLKEQSVRTNSMITQKLQPILVITSLITSVLSLYLIIKSLK